VPTRIGGSSAGESSVLSRRPADRGDRETVTIWNRYGRPV